MFQSLFQFDSLVGSLAQYQSVFQTRLTHDVYSKLRNVDCEESRQRLQVEMALLSNNPLEFANIHLGKGYMIVDRGED